MPKNISIEDLLKSGSKQWNQLRKDGKVPVEFTGATFVQLFSANADLSALALIGSEWEKCDLSKVSFRDTDLSNSYFHGGRLQDCDFRGATLEGVTFEKLKLLRCDFTGAKGLEEIEFDDVDMDRVVGLDGEDAPPPPPPPAVGITSFTREQRAAAMSIQPAAAESDLPPFKPGDSPAAILFRGLKHISNPPPWVLDVPTLRLPLPVRMPPGTSLEHLYREAVKTRLEGRRPVPDMQAVAKAKQLVAEGSQDVALAISYLHEVDEAVAFSQAAVDILNEQLKAAVEVEDPTADVDPHLTLALAELRASAEAMEFLGELRMRRAACILFMALLEAGFSPENNWEEAVDSTEISQDLAHMATNGNRELLGQAFAAFVELPEEVRLRRLAYLAEATAHLEGLAVAVPAATGQGQVNQEAT